MEGLERFLLLRGVFLEGSELRKIQTFGRVKRVQLAAQDQ